MKYSPTAIVLEGVRYDIPETNLVFAIGANGTRKSTIMQIYRAFLESDLSSFDLGDFPFDGFEVIGKVSSFGIDELLDFKLDFFMKIGQIFPQFKSDGKLSLKMIELRIFCNESLLFELENTYNHDVEGLVSDCVLNEELAAFFWKYLRDSIHKNFFLNASKLNVIEQLRFLWLSDEILTRNESLVERLAGLGWIPTQVQQPLFDGIKEKSQQDSKILERIQIIQSFFDCDSTPIDSSNPVLYYRTFFDRLCALNEPSNSVANNFVLNLLIPERLGSASVFRHDFFTSDSFNGSAPMDDFYKVIKAYQKNYPEAFQLFGFKDVRLQPGNLYYEMELLAPEGSWRKLSQIGKGLRILFRLIGMAATYESISNRPGEYLGFADGKVLFLEEPETHMHPNLQEMLGKILFNISVENRVFVETHSEYIIRVIQNQVANPSQRVGPNDVAILNFGREDSSYKSKVVTFKSDGTLSEPLFPGFNDVIAGLTLEQLRLLRSY
jgi:energy-coupling factor transporter ATP-binding protein EcfA2